MDFVIKMNSNTDIDVNTNFNGTDITVNVASIIDGSSSGAVTSVNGLTGAVSLASTNLTDAANILLLNGIQTITGAKTFGANTLLKTGTEVVTNLNADMVDGYHFNQSLQTTDSPTFATIKATNLTDGYIPYHISDASGLGNSPLFIDGATAYVGLGTNTPQVDFEIASKDTTSTLARLRLTNRDVSIIDEQELSEIQFYNKDADDAV